MGNTGGVSRVGESTPDEKMSKGLLVSKLNKRMSMMEVDQLEGQDSDFTQVLVKSTMVKGDHKTMGKVVKTEVVAQEYNSLAGYEQWFREHELKDRDWGTHDAIIAIFDELMAQFDQPETAWKEEDLGNVEYLKAWSNPAGSNLNESLPFLRIEGEMPKHLKADKLIKAMYEFDERKKWDSKIADMKIIANDHPNMSIYGSRNIKIMFFDARQFFDKQIIFKVEDPNSDNTSYIYVYHGSVPLEKLESFEEEFKTIDSKLTYVTAETLYMVQRISYNTDTQDHVTINTFSQIDAKMGFAVKMAAKMMPKLTQQWYESLIKYMSK